jgi:hypothetical protein
LIRFWLPLCCLEFLWLLTCYAGGFANEMIDDGRTIGEQVTMSCDELWAVAFGNYECNQPDSKCRQHVQQRRYNSTILHRVINDDVVTGGWFVDD